MLMHLLMHCIVLQQFLAQNNLKLILRSHEGPDARYKRDDMPSVDQGYALDHQCSSTPLSTPSSSHSPVRQPGLANCGNGHPAKSLL